MSISSVTELSCVLRSNGDLNDSWKLSYSTTDSVLDCLVQDDNTLKCYHGLCSDASTLQNVYTFDTTVIDSFWCYFDTVNGHHDESTRQLHAYKSCNDTTDKCLCVREKGLLTFIMNSGQMHYVPLPFMINGVWPLKQGLLIERKVDVSDGLAVLFSLSHPLDDLCPVTCRQRRTSITGTNPPLSYFTNSSEHVVAMSTTHSLSMVVLYNTIDNIHSIFVIKTAQLEDIPSPVSTPGCQPTSVLGTPHPLSSSAPARSMHISPCVPLKFSLQVESSPKLTNPESSRHQSFLSPDVLKPRALQRVKKETPLANKKTSSRQSLPGILDSATSMNSSGRSPFVNRYKTPAGDPHQIWKKAKSLSPQMHQARISPYSQTVERRSWSTFYSDATLSDNFDLMPQMCLHSIWREQGSLVNSSVTDSFVANDWSNGQFIVLHIRALNRLCFLSLDREDGDCTVCSSVMASIESVAKALYLETLEMILILTVDGVLTQYNGYNKVCNIDTSSVIGTSLGMGTCPAAPNHVISMIRDPIGDSFTIVYNTNRVYECTIISPLIHPVAKLSLKALQSVLPTQTSNSLMANSYCIFHNTNTRQQWTLFSEWIMTSIGIKTQEYHDIKLSSQVQSDLKDDFVFNLINTVSKVPHGCLSQDGLSSSSYKMDQIEPHYIVPLNHCVARVLSVLHLVYEELKLNIHCHCHLLDVACLLYIIARSIGWSAYVGHYTRDHPLLLQHSMTATVAQEWTESHSTMNGNQSPVYSRTVPPGIYPWIHSILNSTNNVKCEPFPVLPTVCKRTEKIVKVYSHLAMSCNGSLTSNSLYEIVGDDNVFTQATNNEGMEFSLSPSATSSIHESLLNILIDEGLSKSIISSLPVGVAFPINCLLLQCRINPLTKWSPEVYEMIGRNDISRTLHGQKVSSESLKLEQSLDDKDDGMDINEEIIKLKFPTDARVREVKRLLQSSRPVRIALEQNPETSDHEFIDIQKSYLLNICQRTMSLSIGRGMFTMATVQPMLFSPMKIPQLNLSGRAPPKNSTVALERTDYPVNMTVWPEFHNGVATALKIDSGTENIDSTWIIFNQPSDEQGINTYAGFLMGLGLNGHLSSLNAFYLFEYLQQKHEVTVIGLLLGLAVARCGSMSLSIASVLSVFLPSLLPQGSVDLETSVLMQTAAMMSLGMVYMGSCNRFIAETFLKQIGHSPGPELEFAQNRECYSLTAGLSLGLIALGAGNSSISLSDLYIVDKLCVYMNGGSKTALLGKDNTGPSYLVQEGDQINTHVTAPGAIVAFGLVYLKTNNSTVAGHLTPPTTPYQLDCIRPDFLMLRVISYSLIMWDSVQPTEQWIDSIIPEVVRQHAFNQTDTVNDSIDYQTMCQSAVYIVSGCCLSLGFKFAGTHQQDVYEYLLKKYKEYTSRLYNVTMIELIGKTCVETFSCVLLLALSMVMSGSGDIEVLRLIRRHHVIGHDMNYGRHIAVHMSLGLLFLGGGRYCLSRSNKATAALLCSVYPHFPSSASDNRYHLQALRHFYMLATEPRVLITRECDTGQSCSVPVDIILKDGQMRSLITPCVIPEWTHLTQIRITNKKYWSLSFDLKEEFVRKALMKNGTIFVERHVGYSSYNTDPQSGVAVMSSKQHQFGTVCEKLDLSMIKLFEEEWVEDYYSYICDSEHKFYGTAFLNCVSKDQMDLISSYLELDEVISNPSDDCVLRLWDVKLCREFCKFTKLQSKLSLTEKSISEFSQHADQIYLKLMMEIESEDRILESDKNSRNSLIDCISRGMLPDGLTTRQIRYALMQLQEMPLTANQSLTNAGTLLEVESHLKHLYDNGTSPSFAAKTIVGLATSNFNIS